MKNAGSPGKKKKLKLEDLVFDRRYHEFRNTQGSSLFRTSQNGSQRYSEMKTHLDIGNFSTLSPALYTQSIDFNRLVHKRD